MDGDMANDLLVRLSRIDQHLEAIALCLCKREGIAFPIDDDNYGCSYGYLPDSEDPEDNELIFPKKK
jgi:hypothetical protein